MKLRHCHAPYVCKPTSYIASATYSSPRRHMADMSPSPRCFVSDISRVGLPSRRYRSVHSRINHTRSPTERPTKPTNTTLDTASSPHRYISLQRSHRQCIYRPTHTLPFSGPLSGTTRVSRYQKGKTNLDFTEARDSEWQRHQLGRTQVCTSLQTDNHASTPPLSFYRPDALPATQPTASKH